MRDWLFNLWELLRGSLWFIPALLTLSGIALAVGLLMLDASIAPVRHVLLWQGDVEGAREVLSTIATSIISVAGVAFSITVVALSLAASQYGSLILANYLRDPVNQSVLGVFVGTFIYCLVVLGNMGTGSAGDNDVAPVISVSFAVVLAVISLAAFILFIHRLTQSMQGDYLVSGVGQALLASIAWIFPEDLGLEPEQAEAKENLTLPEAFEAEAWEIHAPSVGYLQALESDALMRFVAEHDLVLQLNVKPGDFLTQGVPLARVWSQGEVDRQNIADGLRRFFLMGHKRTPTQDIEYSVLQLTQIAVRALSPGINDPITALMCVDWLAAALNRLTRRRIPSGYRFDDHGVLRVVAPVADFRVTVDAAFDTLRRHGSREGQVLIRLVQVAGEVGGNARRQSDRDVLRRHVERLRDEGVASLPMAWEKEELAKCYQKAVERLEHRLTSSEHEMQR